MTVISKYHSPSTSWVIHELTCGFWNQDAVINTLSETYLLKLHKVLKVFSRAFIKTSLWECFVCVLWGLHVFLRLKQTQAERDRKATSCKNPQGTGSGCHSTEMQRMGLWELSSQIYTGKWILKGAQCVGGCAFTDFRGKHCVGVCVCTNSIAYIVIL